MIHLMCPTVRPAMMKTAIAQWLGTASRPDRVRLRLAVNTEEDRKKLSEFDDVLVIGNKRRGAPYPVFRLGQAVVGEPGDIVVLVSDDTFAPQGWDAWLVEVFSGRNDAIIINDGGQFGPCITQPIMTYTCLLKLNRVINHPSYHHFCADAELHTNLCEMGLVRDLRRNGSPVFEHRNWAWGKRPKDEHDLHNVSMWGVDEKNMHERLRMPVADRLRFDLQDLVE